MEFFSNMFGLYADKLSTSHMVVRAVFVFIIALFFVRIAGIRLLGRQTSFDQLTTFILGSILGRMVMEGGNFFGTLVAVLAIMLLHRFTSHITFKSKILGSWIKGDPLLLIDHGKRILPNLKKCLVTDDDITEALHKSLHASDHHKVKQIYIERSGEITFIIEESI